MKKILLTLVSCFLILGFTICTNAEENLTNFDFRQVHWGMTKEEVINSEKIKPIEDPENVDNHLLFITKINNKDCILFYTFNKNEILESAGYIFDIVHTNKNDYISDYQDIKTLLIEKYKQPKFSKLNWKNDLFKYDPDKWGLAISMGDVTFQSMWETETTDILLNLYGDNFKISLGLIYRDINYKADNSTKTEGL